MLHQDGSRFGWLEGAPELDLIITMDDACPCSKIYPWGNGSPEHS
jgi:hypothetical protein